MSRTALWVSPCPPFVPVRCERQRRLCGRGQRLPGHSFVMRSTRIFSFVAFAVCTVAHAATIVPVADMPTDRDRAVAVPLANGKVLVAGGRTVNGGPDDRSSAHLYEPQADIWTATGSMSTQRFGAAGVLLADGRVFVVGGTPVPSNRAEIYDPVTESWSLTASAPGVSFDGPTTTLLTTGKVLVIGRSNGDGSGAVPVLYDALSDTWAVTGPMVANRTSLHAATRLADGRVLVAGGKTSSSPFTGGTNHAEVYDPLTNTWAATGSMAEVRANHAATLLSDGRAFVVSGVVVGAFPSPPFHSAEIFDPASETWSVAAAIPRPRMFTTASLLPSGKVVVAAGKVDIGTTVFSTDIFDPATGTWSFGPDLNTVRSGHSATILSDGRVLLAGGLAAGTTTSPQVSLSSAEIFDESAFGLVIGGGRRPLIDLFLAYAGTHVKDRTTTIANTNPGVHTQVVIFLVIASQGETVFPATAQLTLNGISVPLPALPANGIVPIRLTLTETSNVLLATMDGITPGGASTTTDSDRIIIKCDGQAP